MSQPIYLDTNIYLDYFLDRKNEFGKPLGPIAWGVFKRAINCEFSIVVSDWLAWQLDKNMGSSQLTVLFTLLDSKRKIIRVKRMEDDVQQAKKYAVSNDIDDPLHAVLAKKGGAVCVVTRDLEGYACCKSLIEAKLPENL